MLAITSYSGKLLNHIFQTRNYGSQIKLVEKGKIFQDNALIAKEFTENSFITDRPSGDITDAIEKANEKYKFQPNILLMQI